MTYAGNFCIECSNKDTEIASLKQQLKAAVAVAAQYQKGVFSANEQLAEMVSLMKEERLKQHFIQHKDVEHSGLTDKDLGYQTGI